MDLITVIIPVYNIENCLKHCVYSVINQSYKNLQIILVDDGSTDCSGKVCDELALRDGRIQVIHKKNGGLSDARNAGLNEAKGKYIGFVDGDDYIDKDMYEDLYAAICDTQADMASCGYYREAGDTTDIRGYSKENQVLDRVQAYAAFFMHASIIGCSCCNKLFAKSIFEELRFKEGIQSEDLEFLYRAFDVVERVVCINKIEYHYVYREGSITESPFNERNMNTLATFDEMMTFISEKYPIVQKQGYAYQLEWSLNLLEKAYCLENRKKRKVFVNSIRRRIFHDARNYWNNHYINIVYYVLFVAVLLHLYLPTIWLLKKSMKIYHVLKDFVVSRC